MIINEKELPFVRSAVHDQPTEKQQSELFNLTEFFSKGLESGGQVGRLQHLKIAFRSLPADFDQPLKSMKQFKYVQRAAASYSQWGWYSHPPGGTQTGVQK